MVYSNLSMGIFSMLVSSFFFALMNGCVKLLSSSMSSIEIIFFRSFVMAVLVASMLIYKPPTATYKKGGWGNLVLRSLFGGFGMLAFFYNIGEIPLGVASTFKQSSPIFIVLISMFFLKEKTGANILLFTLLGFVGIVFICDPHLNSIPPLNIVLGIFSALSVALAYMTLRSLREYFHSNVIVLSFGISMSVVSVLIMLVEFGMYGQQSMLWAMPNIQEWFYILLLGLFGTLGQYFLTKAFLLAPAGIVAPIDYTRIVFSAFIGIFFGDYLSITTIFGMVLVIVSGIGIGLPIFLRDFRAIGKTDN